MAAVLILEDDPFRVKAFKRKFIGHSVTVTDNATEAIVLLKSKSWDYLFLDHDLGGEQMVSSGPGTGYEVAKFLEENPQYQPVNIALHSLNPSGRKNMQMALPEAIEAPFCWKEDY